MKVSEEITDLICDSTPGMTPQLLEAALNVASDAQILFTQGEGCEVIDGKSVYPNYLQLEITDAQEAMRLAQQLLNACAEAMSNGGALRQPVSLTFAGQATLSE